MARIDAPTAGGINVLACLDTIAFAEGVGRFSDDDGYDVIVGGERFTGYTEHPRKLVWLPRYRVHSTAAGRYQFLWRTWDALRRRLQLPDFGPVSQDRAAIELLRETGALADIQHGWIASALHKARKTWASLPGAGYGQREHALDALIAVYRQAGGTVV